MRFFSREKQKELQRQLEEKEKLIKELTSQNEELQKKIEEQQKEINRLEAEEEHLLEKLDKILSSMLNPLLRVEVMNHFLQTFGKLLEVSHYFYYKSIKDVYTRIAIVTHRDGDGICCAALYRRYFGEDPYVKVFYIKQGEKDVIKKIKSEKLYITDIKLDENLGKYVLRLKKSGVEVRWIDHHTSSMPKDILYRLINEGILIYDKDATSAARLVRKDLGLNDEISERICKIADACDGGNPKGVEVDEKIVSNLTYLDQLVLTKLVKELAKYGKVRDRELKEKSLVVDLLIVYGKKLLKEKCSYYEDENIQVYLLKARDTYLVGIGKIMSKISNESKKDVYLVIEGKNTTIKGKLGTNADVTFSKIAENFGGSFYSHGKVGTCILKEINMNEFIKFLKELYKDKL